MPQIGWIDRKPCLQNVVKQSSISMEDGSSLSHYSLEKSTKMFTDTQWMLGNNEKLRHRMHLVKN